MKFVKVSLVLMGIYFFNNSSSMEKECNLERASQDLAKINEFLNDAEKIINGMDRTLVVTIFQQQQDSDKYVSKKLGQAAELANESKNLVQQVMTESGDSPEIKKKAEESLCRVENIMKRSNSGSNDQLYNNFSRRLSNGRVTHK